MHTRTCLWRIAVCAAFSIVLKIAYPMALNETAPPKQVPAQAPPHAVRALYLTSTYLLSDRKITELIALTKQYDLNAVVIDVKESAVFLSEKHTKTVKRFNDNGIYTIARIAVFQDSRLAAQRPDLAAKTAGGALWYSGRKEWKRYWTDPASSDVAAYNIAIAKKAIDAGFDELQFDYIRFASDGGRGIGPPQYPVFRESMGKYAVLEAFFARLRSELKAYAKQTRGIDIPLAIDVFGYVYSVGKEPGVGQRIEGVAKYFDVICPMAYPSHYRCGEFGFADPNSHPYEVYDRSLRKGLEKIATTGYHPITRPWLQCFSIRNIYGCAGTGKVSYGPDLIRAQIRAVKDNGISGYMFWNAESDFTRGGFEPIPQKKD